MRYIIIWEYHTMADYLFKDIMNSEEFDKIYTNYPSSNKIINFIRRVHLSSRVNKYFNFPFKYVWYQNIIKKASNDVCIVFLPEALNKIDISILYKIKEKYNKCKIVLLLLDSIHAHSLNLIHTRDKIFYFKWDAVFSFDIYDCKEFGFQFLGYSYYSKVPIAKVTQQNNDLYYAGYNKGNRNGIVLSVAQKCEVNNVKINFNIVNGCDLPINIKGIYCHKRGIPYSIILESVLSSNCILEILQEGQKVQTARYFEAVCYNKKLLTNNPNLKELPFYDHRYMRYFKDVNDIDTEWLKKRENINYGYNNEFSPLHLKNILQSYFDKE